MEDVPLADIRSAAAGDADASRRIVEALHRPVLATVHRFVGRRFAEDIEDIAQEVFLKIFKAIDRFDPDRGVKFTTWAFTFVKNHCFDVLKKRRLPTFSLGGEEDEAGTWELEDAGARKPGDTALNAELGQQIEAALQQLSPDHRMVFVLREFEQMDLKSIAGVMDCSEGTVKSRLHRAKEALKDKLRPYLQT
ncbi:MAG: sigma-70 family RNA polymerase sigma factor [Planctomycetota bacterium]|nr:sigma-70 family RNA polymerase sigma factor [Planctomycetota bacterium]